MCKWEDVQSKAKQGWAVLSRLQCVCPWRLGTLTCQQGLEGLVSTSMMYGIQCHRSRVWLWIMQPEQGSPLEAVSVWLGCSIAYKQGRFSSQYTT